MRKYIVALIIGLLIAFCSFASLAAEASKKQSTPPPEQTNKSAEQDQALHKALRHLIDELDSIMAQPHEKESARRVYDVYTFAKDKIAAGDIIWGIVHDGKEEMHASFAPAKNGEKSYLQLNEYLLNRSKTEPTIALVMIVHEMKHAYDYFTIGEKYKKYMENNLENYMYEMDAIFIEAVLARDYLVSKYKKLTPFEQYLIESLEKDNLASVSLVFLAVDMDFTYYLYKRGIDLGKNMITCRDYLQEFIKQGKELQKLPLNGKEFEKYRNLILIQTYARMASPLIKGAFVGNPKCKEEKSTAAMIKEINDHILKANAIIEQHTPFIQDFVQSVKTSYFGNGPDQK